MMFQRSDLVTDSELETTLSQDGTTHTFHRYIHGRQRVSRHEHWIREKALGRGAFGTVWLETCTRGENEGDLRAVKEIRKLTGPSFSVDYNRELEAIAKFSKPKYEGHFVQSFGWFETAEAVFITMKYFRRGDLELYLQDQRSTLYPREAQQITQQLLEGLDFMHSSGFAHRDIKPGNILLESCPPDAWWIKISDFGISKRVAGTTGVLTVNIGTPGYMAPELRHWKLNPAEENLVDYHAADMWALGQVTFRMLHGEDACQELESCAQNSLAQTRYLSAKLTLSVGQTGLDFIAKAMAVDAESRMTTSAALAHSWMSNLDGKHEERSLFAAPLRNALSEVPSATWSSMSGSTIAYSAPHLNSSAEPESLPHREKTQHQKEGQIHTQEIDEIFPDPPEVKTTVEPRFKALSSPVYHMDLVPQAGWHTLFEDTNKETRASAVEKIDILISQGYAFPLPRQHDGSSTVHFAAKNGLINLINYLHSLGVDMKVRCDNCSTALHWAAKGGHVDMIIRLRSLGLDINAQCDNKTTVVHWAALGGAISMIKHIRSLGLDINARDEISRTALHWAAEGGNVEMVGYLCSLGLKLRARTIGGSTVLHRAAAGGKLAMVKYLCSLGFDPYEANKEGSKLVHFAAYAGSIPMVDYVCSLGLSIEAEDLDGWTAVHWAASNGQIKMIDHLQSLGLDVKAKVSSGQTVIHRAAVSGQITMIDHLCSLGLDIKAKDFQGQTAIHRAAYGGRKAMIDHLCSLGLDVKAKDSQGRTAMHWAALSDKPAMIDLLYSLELDVSAKDNSGYTPQTLAKYNDKMSALEHLRKLEKNQSSSGQRGLRRFFSR